MVGIYDKCKFLAPITKRRVENNPKLEGYYFCLYKLRAGLVSPDDNYDEIVCEYAPATFNDCSKKNKVVDLSTRRKK